MNGIVTKVTKMLMPTPGRVDIPKEPDEYSFCDDALPTYIVTGDLINAEMAVFWRWIWMLDFFGNMIKKRCFCFFETEDQRPCIKANKNLWACNAIGLNKKKEQQ